MMNLRTKTIIAAVIIMFFCVLPVSGAFSGTTIRKVEYVGLTRIDGEELTDIMSIRAGDVFDSNILHKAVKRAFKKGVFRDIRVESEVYGDGIKLRFVLEEIPLIRKIIVNGNEHFSSGRIKDIIPFRTKEDFMEELTASAESDIIHFYNRKGFADARVEIVPKAEGETSLVDLFVNITEGTPLVINKIETDESAKKRMKLSEGDIFDRDILEKDIKKLIGYYKSKNYIDPVVGPYEFMDGILVVPVKTGPKLELIFKGNTVYDNDELEKEVSFIDDRTVTEDILRETAERIRKLYLNKGYYYAQVASGIEKGKGYIRVSFIIFEGKKVILRKVDLEGVSFSRDVIMDIISLKVNKPYDKTMLESSIESLTRFYNALGYLNMSAKDVVEEFDEKGGMNVRFVIDEGIQTRIKEIMISGNKGISEDEIRKAADIYIEAAYNLIDIGDARYRVISLYRRHGYVDAVVDVESRVSGGNALLDLRITENEPSVIGKVILRGNYKTKPKIIKREFGIQEGDPYDFEKLLKIKQRLYKLGIFNEVSIDPYDTGTNAGGSLVKDVIVTLKEGKPGSVEVGVGYGEYEEFRTSADIRYSNLGGYNREVGLKAEYSSVEERYVFHFMEPWLFNRSDLTFNMFLMQEAARKVNIDTNDVLYMIDRRSFLFDIEKEITSRLKANLSYEYAFIDTKDVVPGIILTKEDTGTLGIGSVSTSMFYDTRDNPFNPESGSINGIVLKVASNAFLSETEYFKGTLQSSWYFRLMKKVVFAASIKGGAAYAFGGAKELPLIERFFLGGRTTVRGYSHDTLGPKGGNNDPTGGNAFALVNAELRFDVGKGFGLVTFVDGGNVWRLVDEAGTELKYTAGAGLRYNTPVGPLRLDYGRKLRKENGLSQGEVHFSFGHAF
ncbi:MAG TPA: outer membrane protein assembly factor BamA [Nitrospirae bacterium]|nr:outer membrane protein assembly factor BamA [Nitrospirota bacterium]